jgi:signal peptidase I
VPSYLTWVQLPYLRLPGLAKVQRGDAVVFNFPQDPGRPADKKDHYVKRCMGTPGDSLELRHSQVFIDGEAVAFPERSNAQFSHYVRTRPGQGFSPRQLKKDFDINYVTNMTVNNQNVSDVLQITETEYVVTIPSQSLASFAQMPSIDTMFAMDALAGDSTFAPGTPEALKWYYSNFVAGGMIFPNPMGGHSDSLVYPWTRDNFGPLWIPAKGSTIALNYDTYLKYEHCVNAYEGHELTRELGPEGERFYVDGQPATSYTFALDYYWMMGDNRHNSWDSRYWGFVPETHVVGKPVFIFWSMDSFKSGIDKIRSERLFTVVHGDGKPRSYLIPFLALVGAYYAWEWFRKRKKS